MSNIQNDPSIFLRLNEPALKDWAAGVADQFPFIERIILYQYFPNKFGSEVWKIPTRYAIVFEYGDEIGSYEENFIAHTGALETILDEREWNLMHLNISVASWDRVYNEHPQDGFLSREWGFFPKRIGENMPLGVLKERKHWILYTRGDKYTSKTTNSSESERTFETVYNEAEGCRKIYNRLKKEERLSNDNLAKEILKLDLTNITTGDIHQLNLHYSKKNLARGVRNNLIAIVMNRLDNTQKYTAAEVQRIIDSSKKEK